MQLRKGINLILFMKAVKTCDSDVWFQTEEGDRLNLKSILSQYIFSTITNCKNMLESGRIECRQDSDEEKLKEFLVMR